MNADMQQRRYIIGYLHRASVDRRRIDNATFRNPLPVFARHTPDTGEDRLIGFADGAIEGDMLVADVTFYDVKVEQIPEAMNFGMEPGIVVRETANYGIAVSGEITYLIVGPHAWMAL